MMEDGSFSWLNKDMESFKEYFEEKCWKGYERKGNKKKGKRIVPNCVKKWWKLAQNSEFLCR